MAHKLLLRLISLPWLTITEMRTTTTTIPSTDTSGNRLGKLSGWNEKALVLEMLHLLMILPVSDPS